MTALILTRGFAQQFDYNVIESLKPWGADLHGRVETLMAKTTSPSDYDFSFVIEGKPDQWGMLLSCIPSKRRDFSGSPLRSYLYLSGNAEDAEFARRILTFALSDFWPKAHMGENGVLPRCLDDILTIDVVDGLVGWKGAEKIDAPKWSEEKLVPALRKVADQKSLPSLPGDCVREFLDKAATLFRGGVGVLTGEYRPYQEDPMEDNPNFVLHFSASDIRKVMPNGIVKTVPPPRPFAPRPAPSPKLDEILVSKRGIAVKVAIWIILAFLLLLGIRCLRQTAPQAEPNLSLNRTKTVNVEGVVAPNAVQKETAR